MTFSATRREFLIGGAAAGAGLLSSAACRPSPLFGVETRAHVEPFEPPRGESIDLVSHVLNRCTFGARPGDRESLLRLGATADAAVNAWIEAQLHPERTGDEAPAQALRRFAHLMEPAGELYEYKPRVLLRDFVCATVLRAVLSRRQLEEVMVELWTDHFNIDISKGDCAWLKVADDHEVIRRHALGRFRDLLRASATSPAMLWYLDGRVNRYARAGDRPNENYARELLELHTVGVHGGYTQRDVMEVARGLTGWSVRPKRGFGKARVEFHSHEHDDGAKVVLGQRLPAGGGEADLDRVLDIVVSHPATARHIAGKLCRRFLADEPGEAAVAAVAETFTRTQGDIRATLRAVFARPEFREDAVRGAKLKRPFHYVVSALRATDAVTDAGPRLVDFLTSMGQAPFQYPTPDGYPTDAASWRGTLVWRWKLASALAANQIHGTRIDVPSLRRRAGGDEGLMAHVLGRRPSVREVRAWTELGGGAAGMGLLLASPAFQRC